MPIDLTETVIKLVYSEAQGLPGPQGPVGPQGPAGDPESPFTSLRMATGASTPAHAEGTLYWDNTDHTLAVMTEVSGTVLQVGQENFLRARNVTGTTIPDGSVVCISGATGNRPRVCLARADDPTLASSVIGITTAAIANNSDGYVTTFGLVRGVNTSAFAEGAALYLSATVFGGLTATRPAAPNHGVRVGLVTVAHNNGTMFVSVDLGVHLGDAHDVLLTNPTTKDLLQYDGTKWVNIPVGWEDERFPASGVNPIGAVSDPTVDATETGFPGTLLFSGTLDNLVVISAQMSHSWEAGTGIRPHIHWSNPTGTANAVTWQLYYRLIGNPGGTPGAWVGPLTVSATVGSPAVSDQTLLSAFPEIPMTGLTESAMVLFRLYRRGSTDASSGTARLYEFDFHYKKNKIGSATEYPS